MHRGTALYDAPNCRETTRRESRRIDRHHSSDWGGGVRRVLPFALPAVAVAGTGSILAFVASAHAWVTGLAVLAVVGAWGWIVWLSVRARRLPAAPTLYMMGGATVLLSIAVLWPLIEHQLARVLRV